VDAEVAPTLIISENDHDVGALTRCVGQEWHKRRESNNQNQERHFHSSHMDQIIRFASDPTHVQPQLSMMAGVDELE
jgi:hypothetical protein